MKDNSILIVDDSPENLVALEKILQDPDRNIMKAESGNKALGLMLNHDFALVILDVQMPGMDGFETAKLMRSNERTKRTPIIFVTAISKEQKHVFKGYQSGAVDYIFKPIDPFILQSKINIFLELYRQRKAYEIINNELKHANKKILEQQKAVIEEERLKVLLQMAGATAHDLNQPLMALLGNIELMVMNKDKPEKLYQHLSRVEEAGTRISEIVKKIQGIHNYETIPYLDQTSITKKKGLLPVTE
ncbi:MAG: response regulator [Deltaproteobacteria bacterium]|nr:response regulator [Deltaproteobacteria bacterium]